MISIYTATTCFGVFYLITGIMTAMIFAEDDNRAYRIWKFIGAVFGWWFVIMVVWILATFDKENDE
jgi:uncharacterized membrane protein HdeD (DUF308 family)